MGLLTSREDLLVQALTNQNPQIQFQRCMSSVEHLIKGALNKDPRLLAFLEGYEYSYMSSGLMRDYDIILKYRAEAPASLSDVVLDNGSWDAESLLTKGIPQNAVLVTRDPPSVSKKLDSVLERMLALYEGIHGYETRSSTFDKLSDYTLMLINHTYIVPMPQLRQYQAKAAFAAKTIWRTILGRANVPQFVKPFLAMSYLAQECTYDQRCYDELESNPGKPPSDPIPHLAYGPLVENRGICGGLAWAFKQLMDEARIACIVVPGYLKPDTKIGHAWNLVKLDNQYYHVDPTVGIRNNGGVYIGLLMQPDSIVRTTHIWDESHYPQARGMRFDYDFVEEFLVQNGDDFIDAGANEKYFFPDQIIE